MTSAWLLATTRLANGINYPDGFDEETRDSIIIDHAVDELYDHESIAANHLDPERFEQHFEWKSNRFVQSVRAIANVFQRALFSGIPQGYQLMLEFQDYDKAGYLILSYPVFERST